jgi:hypothetical protein
VTLPTDLVPILEDLRVGLRRRAAHRRRARAGAATVLSTVLLAVVGVSTAERLAGAGTPGSAGAASVAFAPDGLYGCSEGLPCWPGDVKLPKHRDYRDR